MPEEQWLVEQFEANRAHLRRVAYRMLGSRSETDDAVQEAWIRLRRADTSGVENLGGWPLEEQADWAIHAAFMDTLFDQRFAALVGPLEGTRDALLVVRASSAAEIDERLALDPWTASGLLITRQISSWQLRLGSLP
jgi:Sigma-70 region 2